MSKLSIYGMGEKHRLRARASSKTWYKNHPILAKRRRKEYAERRRRRELRGAREIARSPELMEMYERMLEMG